jgi:hypothetical protein
MNVRLQFSVEVLDSVDPVRFEEAFVRIYDGTGEDEDTEFVLQNIISVKAVHY